MGSRTAELQHDWKKETNRVQVQDNPVHNWYRFVLSYPPHLVRNYNAKLNLRDTDTILDPFCGTGTTLVEAKFEGIPSYGIEANPVAALAAQVKTNWEIDCAELDEVAKIVSSDYEKSMKRVGLSAHEMHGSVPHNLQLQCLTEEQEKVILRNSICPLPLHRVLCLKDAIEQHQDSKVYDHLRIALARIAVTEASNLYFGPEVGVRGRKNDALVGPAWRTLVSTMVKDLETAQETEYGYSKCIRGDSRQVISDLPDDSISAVITSPPYPNEKDYTRTTRLESVLLGFLNDRDELRAIKSNLLRSNTRNVYKMDTEDSLIEDIPEVVDLADKIEQKRKDLGKTSGFEKMYHRVTRLYFGGMAAHFLALHDKLVPGANLAYVVGDQASFFRINIRTSKLLGIVAEKYGFKVVGTDLFRKRYSTATRSWLREDVLLLEKMV